MQNTMCGHRLALMVEHDASILHTEIDDYSQSNKMFFRYIDAEPSWAKQLEGEMTRGKHVITFRARSPVSNQSASCQVTGLS